MAALQLITNSKQNSMSVVEMYGAFIFLLQWSFKGSRDCCSICKSIILFNSIKHEPKFRFCQLCKTLTCKMFTYLLFFVLLLLLSFNCFFFFFFKRMFHDELMCVFVSFHQKWNPFSTCKNKVQRSCLKYMCWHCFPSKEWLWI